MIMVNNNFGFLRVFLPRFKSKKANIEENLEKLLSFVKNAEREKAGLVVFPPFSITSPNCGSLFFQHHLLSRQNFAIKKLTESTTSLDLSILLHHYDFLNGRLVQKLSILQRGKISSSIEIKNVSLCEDAFFNGAHNNFSSEKLLFDEKNQLSIGIDTNADIQIFLDSEEYSLGKMNYYETLIESTSSENNNIAILNSSNTLAAVCENGSFLGLSSPYDDSGSILVDVDTNLIKSKKLHKKTFIDVQNYTLHNIDPIYMWRGDELLRDIKKLPFIPSDKNKAIKNMEEVFNIQVSALAERLAHTSTKHCVIGISGGLDSTLALLVSVFAHKKLNLPLSNIVAITMPGFGTTSRTYTNAVKMIKSLGVTFKEISIKNAVTTHLKDIEHSVDTEDITFENAQARERTQILMDYANKISAIVVGTGDLSEMALGWCTYNGDHMSMFSVNAGLPKTLIQYVIRWFIDFPLANSDYFLQDTQTLKEALEDVLATPISPELLSPSSDGSISQKTEDKVGPYPLHDFFIYHTLYYGAPPKKLLYLATQAFAKEYDEEFIRKWLKVFYKRFFTQQFKRNCSPDSPVIMADISLNYDKWLMDSDLSYREWISEL